MKLSNGRIKTDEPLESLFHGPEGEFIILAGRTFSELEAWGPFYSDFVAREWALDSLPDEPLIMREIRTPFKTRLPRDGEE